MSEEPDSILHAIRMLGASYETFVAANISNGQSDELSAEDVKYAAIVALMVATETKNRLNAYETRSADEWMSVEDATAMASCSRRTIFRAIKNGELISKKMNGHRVIQRQSLDQFAQYRSLFDN